MLLLPTLGFYMEQYFPTLQKPGHLGKSIYIWVAVTLGGCNLIKGKERKWPEYKCLIGCHWHLPWVHWHPTRVPTTHIRWPPSEVHCATHERQSVCNPMPKTQTRRPKNATQRLPNWWRPPDWIDMVTVTHVNRVTSNFTDIYPNCSRGGSGRHNYVSGERRFGERRAGTK